MNPNGRRVYTCISSADNLCITYSIHSFCLISGGGEGCLDYAFFSLFFCKSVPETKSKSSSSQMNGNVSQNWGEEKCAKVLHPHWKEMSNKGYRKFCQWSYQDVRKTNKNTLVSTFHFTLSEMVLFTRRLSGCSPPSFPPTSSPPQKTHFPSHQFSSFLAYKDSNFIM